MTTDPVPHLKPELVPRLGPAIADYPPGSTFGPREALNYQFVWILRGRSSWSCRGVDIDLVPGRLLLVRPGMRDTFQWDSEGPTRHAYVHFSLTGIEHLPPVDSWPLCVDDDPRGLITVLCGYLLWLAGSPEREHRVRDVLRLLICLFVLGPLPGDDDPPLPAPLRAMAAHVSRVWSDGVARPLSLKELAEAASVSTSSLCRLFREQFGTGPVATMELLRLARAEPLLWMSNLPLSAIAVQCGFSDAYHFSRRFSAVYGISPSGFRAQETSMWRPTPTDDAGLRRLRRAML